MYNYVFKYRQDASDQQDSNPGLLGILNIFDDIKNIFSLDRLSIRPSVQTDLLTENDFREGELVAEKKI